MRHQKVQDAREREEYNSMSFLDRAFHSSKPVLRAPDAAVSGLAEADLPQESQPTLAIVNNVRSCSPVETGHTENSSEEGSDQDIDSRGITLVNGDTNGLCDPRASVGAVYNSTAGRFQLCLIDAYKPNRHALFDPLAFDAFTKRSRIRQ